MAVDLEMVRACHGVEADLAGADNKEIKEISLCFPINPYMHQ